MSRAYIFKQDPSTTEIEPIRLTYTPFRIRDGPSDDRVVINGGVSVKGDARGDFLVKRTTKQEQKAFDSVHVFMVIRQALTMYDRSLQRLSRGPAKIKLQQIQWQWGSGTPMKVNPLAGNDKNAYYSRGEKALKFFYFPDPKNKNKMVYTARSFDVVAHEAGHAILDGILPGYLESWQPQTGGLHEAFGDITAILSLLGQLDQCEAVIAHSKADLHAKSFFPAVAEQFGEALYGHRLGLRNADNDLRLDQVSEQVHDVSQVFTGAFYDILADIFDAKRDPTRYDDAHVLWQVGQYMSDLLLGALLKGPPQNATYADIAQLMIKMEKNKKFQAIIRNQFTVRRVLGSNALKPSKKPTATTKANLWQSCHCSLSTKEHLQMVQNAIDQQQGCLPCGGQKKPAHRAKIH